MIPDSTGPFYCPNRMGRILLLAYEEVVGRNALVALLTLIESHGETQRRFPYVKYIDVAPPLNSDRQFPFEAIGGLTQALIDMYGPRQLRSVAGRIGRVTFKHGLSEYGQMMGVTDLTFQLLPLSIKLEKGAQALAALYNDHTDQRVRIHETADMLYWHVERNPVCWGVEATQPVCHLTVGLLQESLLWLSGGKDFQLEETTCMACGDDVCTIAITKKPLD